MTLRKGACAFAFVFILHVCQSITFDRCDLARKFLHEYKFRREHLDDWICLVRWESHYNSSAIGTLNWDGSKDLGLFQISDKWWCEYGKWGKGCDIKCEDLLDDNLDDDVKCVKRIYKEHQGLSNNGFNAWVAWKTKCQGDLSEFLEGCDLKKKSQEEEEAIQPIQEESRPSFYPGVVAPESYRVILPMNMLYTQFSYPTFHFVNFV